jgi:hypothetical protein
MSDPLAGGVAVQDAVGKVVGEAVGHAVVIIASEFGKRIVAYWQQSHDDSLPASQKDDLVRTLPPYAIVGVGRCGSHISAELARLLIAKNPVGSAKAAKDRIDWLTLFFRKDATSHLQSPRPMLVIGDIDETTFDDIERYFQGHAESLQRPSTLRKLDYRPLAHGGAGHVPAFGEFLTRGLLLLSPYDDSQQCRPWADARRYLVESCIGGSNTPRLVFYVFSAGGGTGSGAAAELVRAQRVAINLSENPDPELYLTGITVIPRGLIEAKNRRRLINTGRLLVQYMAEMNIKVNKPEDYMSAQVPLYSFSTTDPQGNKKRVLPWDSLGIISNEVMADLGESSTYENAEGLANRYIAQQIFSMAASQVRTEERRTDDGKEPSVDDALLPSFNIGAVNFQSTRLDPHDLKTSLRGPYAIAFSTATQKGLENPAAIDAMFLRAISLPSVPHVDAEGVKDMIYGLSVIPEDRSSYLDKLARLNAKITAERDSGASNGTLNDSDLTSLSQIPFFGQCPRAIFVISVPEHAELLADVPERLSHLLSWLMPKLNEARYAVVRHPNDYFTLSIFVQSSVVLCPELQKSIRNFIKLCWSCRAQTGTEFNAQFDGIMTQDPPIMDDQIAEWIGEAERYDQNVDDFASLVKELQDRWISFVETNVSDAARKRDLANHRVEDCLMRAAEIAAAMRFMNYVQRLAIPEIA